MKKYSFLQEYRITRMADEHDPDADMNDERAYGMRPDGTHDGLDDLNDEPVGLGMDEPEELGLDREENLDGEEDPEGREFDSENPLGPLGDEEEMPRNELSGTEEEPSPDGEEEEAGLGDGEPEDENFQGVIRTVTGACLIYKRADESGTFEELWIYNTGERDNDSMGIRKAILAGTDIGQNSVSSEDGAQEAKTYSIGNVQYLNITGLPN